MGFCAHPYRDAEATVPERLDSACLGPALGLFAAASAYKLASIVLLAVQTPMVPVVGHAISRMLPLLAWIAVGVAQVTLSTTSAWAFDRAGLASAAPWQRFAASASVVAVLFAAFGLVVTSSLAVASLILARMEL
jgi:hypothetical protein